MGKRQGWIEKRGQWEGGCIKVLHYLELQNNFNWQFNYLSVLGKFAFPHFNVIRFLWNGIRFFIILLLGQTAAINSLEILLRIWANERRDCMAAAEIIECWKNLIDMRYVFK